MKPHFVYEYYDNAFETVFYMTLLLQNSVIYICRLSYWVKNCIADNCMGLLKNQREKDY